MCILAPHRPAKRDFRTPGRDLDRLLTTFYCQPKSSNVEQTSTGIKMLLFKHRFSLTTPVVKLFTLVNIRSNRVESPTRHFPTSTVRKSASHAFPAAADVSKWVTTAQMMSILWAHLPRARTTVLSFFKFSEFLAPDGTNFPGGKREVRGGSKNLIPF